MIGDEFECVSRYTSWTKQEFRDEGKALKKLMEADDCGGGNDNDY